MGAQSETQPWGRCGPGRGGESGWLCAGLEAEPTAPLMGCGEDSRPGMPSGGLEEAAAGSCKGTRVWWVCWGQMSLEAGNSHLGAQGET